MVDIVVIGGGGHARVLISALKRSGTYRVVGYTDRTNRNTILGIPYLGTDTILRRLKLERKKCAAAIGVGAVGVPDARKRIMVLLKTLRFDLPVIISKDAIVAEDVMLGEATVVFAGAVVNAGTRIGQCCIINTNSTVEHDCVIADHTHIATGATISGGGRIGENCFIGAGSTIVQGVTICPNCVVGAGAVIHKSIRTKGTYVGIPARRLK